MDGDDAEPVEQILPEAALGDLLLQVLVGGSDHPHIHLDVLVAPNGGDAALLQGAQHLGLRGQRHVADLVQEEGAAVRQLELALAVLDGAGEAALHVAEELALDQLAGYGSAIHLDIGAAGSAALLVDEPRHPLLACPVPAGDEDARIAGRHLLDHLADLAEGLALADHLHGAALGLAHFLPQHLGLLHQVAAVQRIANADQDAIDVRGLLDEVESPLLQRIHSGIDGAMPADHHHGQVGGVCLQLLQHLDAIHLGHLDVAEHQVESALGRLLQSCCPVLRLVHLVLLVLEYVAQCGTDRFLVVDDEDMGHG